ncbi:hypothetical protein LXL04_029278 [Taraxacum kok-saghyz]
MCFHFLNVEATDNYLTLKLHYGGVFTKVPGRKYINDFFSVHDVNEMVRDIGYFTKTPLCYQYCKPKICLDYGLMPLGNDHVVLTMMAYIPTHREISVYIETGETTTFIYFKSPSKVIIEELDEPTQVHVVVSPEMDKDIKWFKEGEGSCISQSSQVINPQVEAFVEVVIEGVGTQGEKGDEVNVVTQDDGGKQDETATFYNVIQPDEDEITQLHYNSEGESDESSSFVLDEGWGEGEGDYNRQDEIGEEGEDSIDSDFYVQDSNLNFDVDVDMNEFMSAVDVDEHGILLIDVDGGDYAGFVEDERKTMLMELNRPSSCSEGVVHVKAFKVGQLFKTKEEVESFVSLHAVNSRRGLYLAKNNIIRVRVTCKGVVGESGEDSGGPSTRSKLRSKCKSVINKQATCPWAVQISRSNENEDWMTRSVKSCTSKRYTNILQQIQSNSSIDIKQSFDSNQSATRRINIENAIGHVEDYCLELSNTNPRTTVRLDVQLEGNSSSTTRVFRRIYVCLGE